MRDVRINLSAQIFVRLHCTDRTGHYSSFVEEPGQTAIDGISSKSVFGLYESGQKMNIALIDMAIKMKHRIDEK